MDSEQKSIEEKKIKLLTEIKEIMQKQYNFLQYATSEEILNEEVKKDVKFPT